MAFRATDGEFLWQATHDKLPAGRVNDWPLQGICSTPYVDGDRVYYVSNRGEVVAADPDGFRDGKNDGVQDEALKTEIDADILWRYDMIGELDVFPHNLAAGIAAGDRRHRLRRDRQRRRRGAHQHPVAARAELHRASTRTPASWCGRTRSPAEKIFHGTWSNAAYGTAGGREQVVFPGGDGWVYSFEPKTGKLIWKFDANPKGAKYELGGAGTANEIIATPVFYDGKVYVGVGQDPEHGEAPGHFWAIDASKTGDVTEHRHGLALRRRRLPPHDLDRGDPRRPALRERPLRASSTASTPRPASTTGRTTPSPRSGARRSWPTARSISATRTATWSCSRAGTTKKVLGEINMGGAVYTTPVAKDGVLYIATRAELFAIAAK